MLDHVVHAEVGEVEGIVCQVPGKELGGATREEMRERHGHVVRLLDGSVQL